jgi:hypothetical protein
VVLMKLKKAKAVTTIRNKAQKPETFMIYISNIYPQSGSNKLQYISNMRPFLLNKKLKRRRKKPASPRKKSTYGMFMCFWVYNLIYFTNFCLVVFLCALGVAFHYKCI